MSWVQWALVALAVAAIIMGVIVDRVGVRHTEHRRRSERTLRVFDRE